MRASVDDSFGVDISNQIWSENLGVWTDKFGDEAVDLITEAAEFGKIYTYEACIDETGVVSTGRLGQIYASEPR